MMLARQEAIICSMTKRERRDPKLILASRKKRIAAGITSVSIAREGMVSTVQFR